MQAENQVYVYVGSYSPKEKEGIHAFAMDAASGELRAIESVSGFVNPSFLAIHSQSGCLYAVNESSDTDGAASGAVSAFRIDRATGRLSFLNRRLSGGPGPCHLSVDHAGSCVMVANYVGGNVSLLPIRSNGELDAATSTIQHKGSSVHPQRQTRPHAHSIAPDPTDRYALAADLGLDQVLVYRIDADSKRLVPHSVPHIPVQPGAGPRHLDFHPSGRYVYVINEIGNTVMVFTYDADNGVLEHTQTVPSLPSDFHGTSHTADIHVLPGGRFLYGSNRGHDSLCVYSINQDTGMCTPIGHTSTGGRTPRGFAIDPSGSFVFAANQDSDTIVCFRVDGQTGELTSTGATTRVPKPSCVKFLSTR